MNLNRAAFWTATYIASILLVNWLFAPSQIIPGLTLWSTPWGDVLLANLVVGAVFVFRDYAQRELGHKILLATLCAGALTYFIVDPAVAVASLVAFIISETADWGVFSFWKKSLQSRILISSLIAVPLDTAVFQHLIGVLSPSAFVMEVVSKAVGVFIVWQLLKMRSGNATATAH